MCICGKGIASHVQGMCWSKKGSDTHEIGVEHRCQTFVAMTDWVDEFKKNTRRLAHGKSGKV